MLKKFAFAAVHLAFFIGVLAIAGYWGIRIFTPSPIAAPPPLPPPPLRDPDPVAAARMFGKVNVVQQIAANVQAVGVFAAGKDSSAVLVVDGKPARVFLIGQEVAPGMKLVSVTSDVAVLETGSGQQEVRLPSRPIAQFGGPPAETKFFREGNTLTAPSSDGAPNIPRSVPPPRTAPPPPAIPPSQPQQFPAQPVPQPQMQPQAPPQVPQQVQPQMPQAPQPIIPGSAAPQAQ